MVYNKIADYTFRRGFTMINIKGILFYTVKTICYILLFLITFSLCLNFFDSFYKGCKLYADMEATGVYEGPVQVYYTLDNNVEFTGDLFDNVNIPIKDGRLSIKEKIKLTPLSVHKLRLDPGNSESAHIVIRKLTYQDDRGYCNIDLNAMGQNPNNHDVKTSYENGVLDIVTTGKDPYIVAEEINVTPFKNHNDIWAGISAIVIVFLIYRYVRLKSVYSMALDLWQNRTLIFSLAKNDFKTKYSGSYFGAVWAFVQPVCTILVFWFVFQVGFRSTDVGNVPFIIWFIAGIIPWFFFSDAWSSASNCLIEYSFLVKKVVFKVHILPLVKIISNLFVHIFFVCFMLFIYFIYGLRPNIYTLQILYYSFCTIVLVISLSLITAPLMVFFKDLGQMMNIILQFGMWLTPILWNIDIIPANLRGIFKLNPMYYVVQGYRDSLIYNVVFYNNIKQTLYFWIVVFALMLIGCIIFGKLRPHFADVL